MNKQNEMKESTQKSQGVLNVDIESIPVPAVFGAIEAVESSQAESQRTAPTRVDSVVTKMSHGLYQGTSRRGFLTKIGRVAMAATGIQLLHALPVDRLVPEVDAEAHFCEAWYNCGIQAGRQCECCFFPSQLCLCPSGTSAGSNWVSCCSGVTIAYWDCCASGGQISCLNPSCNCHRGPGQPVWCGQFGSASYYCTTTCVTGIGC